MNGSIHSSHCSRASMLEGQDHVTKAHAELEFIQAASDFAMFYMGVGEVLDTLFPQIHNGTDRSPARS